MRLKQALLCTLLFVLVRSNTFSTDYTCTHDGFSTSDGCQCTDLYGPSGKGVKNPCTQIQCVNSGVLAPYERDTSVDQRCSCPPGFLGMHCEAVQCVEADVNSFARKDHSRDVSVIITYNNVFQDQFNSKDKAKKTLDKTICESIFKQDGVDKGSTVKIFLMEDFIEPDDENECVDLFSYIVENNCDDVLDENKKPTGQKSCEGKLDTNYLLGAIYQMGEDSRLIIISNLGIDLTKPSEEGIEAIRKKAISMRIQIHSLVISPREPNPPSVYFNDDVGFQTLRELTESTLGFFINPFDPSGGQKNGENGITDIINDMMVVFFEYVVVDRIITTEQSCRDPNKDFTVFRALEETNEFWLTVISNKPQYSSYTTSFIGGLGVPPVKAIDAGYFNAYTLKADEGDLLQYRPFSTMGSKCVPSTVMVLARSGHLARFAITNDEDKDATSPYAISGDKNVLVGHFTQHYHEENLETLYLEFSAANESRKFGLNLDPLPSPRGCQYNVKFGEVMCNDGDDTFIRVRDSTDGAAVTVQNLYCSPQDTAKVTVSQFLSFIAADDPTDTPVCQESDVTVKKDGRALIISAHATKTIYGLFNGNKNSAIKYLNDLDDLGIYDQYIVNIYNANLQTNAKVSYSTKNDDGTVKVDGFPQFKDELMSGWHSFIDPTDEQYTTEHPAPPEGCDGENCVYYFDKECDGPVSQIYPLEDITNQITTNARSNSDIIFIYDRKMSEAKGFEIGWDKDVLKDAHKKRLRLIVLLLGCDDSDFSISNELKEWQSFASKTGGFAVHFSKADDLNDFLGSYTKWVVGETAATIDNNAQGGFGFTMDPVTSTPFSAKKGGKYTIVVNAMPLADQVTVNGVLLAAPDSFGNSVLKYDYVADKDGPLTVAAKPVQYFYYASIRVLDMNGDYATIGFATDDKACLDKSYPDYNPTEPQYPITVAEAATAVHMNLFDNTGKSFREGDATGAKSGNFELNYNWKCNDNENIFYISADVTTAKATYTRVLTTQCVGDSEEILCLNGGIPKKYTTSEATTATIEYCECPHDYTGENCEIPVCQNGGTPNVALECDCTADYSGFFCENYMRCKADPAFDPKFNSIATTIIFVVERSEDVVKKLEWIPDPTKSDDPGIFDDAKAAQYIVVEYGSTSEVKVLISTTDKSSLVDVLRGITVAKLSEDDYASSTITPGTYFDPVAAIAAALDVQVTTSAQLFWFASTDQADCFAKDLYDAIAHQRVSITALFTESVIDAVKIPVHPVQMAGGSVYYFPADSTDDYQNFFTNYVAVLLQFQSKFELRPNLLSSSDACGEGTTHVVTHVVNIDQSTQKLFVSANQGATIAIDATSAVNLAADSEDTANIPGGKVFTFKTKKGGGYIGTGQVTVTITGQKDKEDDGSSGEVGKPLLCSSSVTAFNQIQVGYGFAKDEDDMDAALTTKKGKHLLVTYWTAESDEDTPTPTASITPITLDGGFGNTTELYTTVRKGCSYSLSVPIDCSDGIDAYGVVVSNWVVPSGGGSAAKVDKYIPVLCPEGACDHGNLTADGGCECDPFWGGDYCNEDLCKNGLIDGDKCVCFTGFTGDACKDRVDRDDRDGIAYLLIQDVCGTDEGLKEETKTVLTNFMQLYNKGEVFYLGTNDPGNSDVVLVKDVAALKTQMGVNAGSGACTASIAATLDSYYNVLWQPVLTSSTMMFAASNPAIGTANVAHVTTVAVDKTESIHLNHLTTDFHSKLEFVGITQKNDMFPSPNGFEPFTKEGGKFFQTYDPDVAVVYLTDEFPGAGKYTTPDPAKYPRCIQDLQAAFLFHNDISSVPNMATYRSKAQKIISTVIKYFTIPDVKNIDIDDDTCEFNKDQMEAKTLFYGSIYANTSSIGVDTFCLSNMNSYPGTVATADYKQSAQVNLQSVIDSYAKWYNSDTKMMCHCFDYQNPNTTKIMLWMPLSPTSLDTGAVSFKEIDTVAHFQHIVVPFGFNYAQSSVWRSLVPDNSHWLTDAANTDDVEKIVQDIWTITCRLAGRIDDSFTAEPYNPFIIKSASGDVPSNDDPNFSTTTESSG